MNISMYNTSVPLLIRGLTQLGNILDKGAAYADAIKTEPSVLVNARLFPNMFTLARQVQITTDTAKGCGARLAGLQPPSYEDNESSFEELKARVDKTIAFLQTCNAEDIDGSEDRLIELKLGSKTMQFTGHQYLTGFVLPNFYFHITTAYNILRHNGVAVGKPDYLGEV